MPDKKKEPIKINIWDEKAYQEEATKVAGYKTSLSPEDRITGILMDTDIASVSFWENFARAKAKAILEDLRTLEEFKDRVNPN